MTPKYTISANTEIANVIVLKKIVLQGNEATNHTAPRNSSASAVKE
jgi:hypothetical protein